MSEAAGYHREDACDRRLFVRPSSVMKMVSKPIGKLYPHSLNLNNRYYLGFLLLSWNVVAKEAICARLRCVKKISLWLLEKYDCSATVFTFVLVFLYPPLNYLLLPFSHRLKDWRRGYRVLTRSREEIRGRFCVSKCIWEQRHTQGWFFRCRGGGVWETVGRW